MLRFVAFFAAALSFCATAFAQSAQYPPSAEAGQCFARVLSPAVYETVTEEVLVAPESYEIEVIPAVYEMRTERVLVREETSRFSIIPPVMETVEERVMIEPERIEKYVVPAQFETYTETVVVQPERVTWRPGSGLYGRSAVAPGTSTSTPGEVSTGDVLCRVVIPAEVRTITRSRMIAPPRVEERVIPARFETITRQVVAQPARYVEEVIPAVYEERSIRVVVTPAQERRILVPAVYDTVTREVAVGGNQLHWAEVLCETNTNRFKVAEIQAALTDAGFPTLIDGAFGPRTQRAMEAFQREHGLSVGYMTVETAYALDIDPYGPPPEAVYAALGAPNPNA